MPIVEERLKEMKKEVSELYKKARIKEEYEKVVNLTTRYAITIASLHESSDVVVSTLLDGYWAEYYLLLKFPSTEERKQRFLEMIKNLRGRVEDIVNQAELVYLLSVAWSHLFHDQEQADRFGTEMKKLVLRGKVPEVLILKWINSRVIDKMDSKDWRNAIEIANEIGGFTGKIVEQPENIGAAANIINNRGASKVRGDIDIEDGIKDLVTALDYYFKQTPVPIKHIEGIKNRLMEAIKKL